MRMEYNENGIQCFASLETIVYIYSRLTRMSPMHRTALFALLDLSLSDLLLPMLSLTSLRAQLNFSLSRPFPSEF